MRMTATAHIPKQVLGQKHFSGLKTQLGETGIDFCSWIGPDDRECMFCNVEEVDAICRQALDEGCRESPQAFA